MFDFAWTHLFLVVVVAAVLLGPKELPVVLQFLGRTVAKLRHHTAEFREYIEAVSNIPATTPPPESGTSAPGQQTKDL